MSKKDFEHKKAKMAKKMVVKTMDSARTSKPLPAGGWHSKKGVLAKKMAF